MTEIFPFPGVDTTPGDRPATFEAQEKNALCEPNASGNRCR